MSDPQWPRAGAWFAGELGGDGAASLSVLGVPLHKASISPSRADLAPAAIRSALSRFSLLDTAGSDLMQVSVKDAGDVPVAGETPEGAFEPVAAKVRELAGSSDVVVALGGDNSITRPAIHGLGSLDRIGLVTFDAHFDLRDTNDGLSNGNPIRALLEDGLPGPHIAQIGIQSFANSPAHAEFARSAGIHVVDRHEIALRGMAAVAADNLERIAAEVDVVYVDFDMDVLDRVFAPGTPGSRPGGISPHELRQAARICGAHPKVAAIDIVEVSPPDDVADVTVMAAAQVFLECSAGLASRADR